jgi:hypothetical protein
MEKVPPDTQPTQPPADDPANPRLYSMVYLSTALKPFSTSELVELLQRSRQKNERRGITGMLLYKKRHFMQALEGPESEVRALEQIIRADPRHFGMVVLLEGQAEERHFADWSMGFRDLERDDPKTVPGLENFADVSLEPAAFEQDPSLAQKLLSAFWRKMMR